MLDWLSPDLATGVYHSGWISRRYRRFLTLTLNNAILGIAQELLPVDQHDFLVITNACVHFAPGPTASVNPVSNVQMNPQASGGQILTMFGAPAVFSALAPGAGAAAIVAERGPWIFFPGDLVVVNALYGVADAANRVDLSLWGYLVSLETRRR